MALTIRYLFFELGSRMLSSMGSIETANLYEKEIECYDLKLF
jgi:hypothetical protein